MNGTCQMRDLKLYNLLIIKIKKELWKKLEQGHKVEFFFFFVSFVTFTCSVINL